MAVFKTKITVTVLCEEPFGDGATLQAALSNMDLADICHEMDQGDFVGIVEVGEPEEIAADKVAEELEAVGNDGSFFGDEQ